MPKTTASAADKGRRSRLAGVLLALVGVGLIPSTVLAWQGESIALAIGLTLLTVAAAVLAVMAFRAAHWWAKLATAEQPRTDVSQVVALSDAREHAVYASVGNDSKERDLAKAELRAAQDMDR